MIEDNKMDHSQKPAIHFDYLRFYSTHFQVRQRLDSFKAIADLNRYLAKSGRWKDSMIQLVLDRLVIPLQRA
jgi:hypothetical protein